MEEPVILKSVVRSVLAKMNKAAIRWLCDQQDDWNKQNIQQ